MRKLFVHEFMTLEGIMQAPGGPEEDTDGGFSHGGWSIPYFDPDVMGAAIGQHLTLDIAFEHAVLGLNRGKRGPSFELCERVSIGELPRSISRCPDVEHLSHPD